MYLYLVRTVLVVLAIGALVIPAAAIAGPRIIGGEKVPDADYQARYTSTVSIQASFSGVSPTAARGISDRVTHTCGGTLISPRLVVTAAHCVATDGLQFGTQGYEVLAGTSALAKTRTSVGRVAVSDVFIHPSYRSTSTGGAYFSGWFSSAANPSEFDIAVLQLERPITSIAPTPLVSAAEDAAAWGAGAGRSSGAVALGWGEQVAPFYSGRRARTSDLRSVGLIIRSDRRCARSDEGLGRDAASFDADTMLCAGTADGPRDGNVALAACYGDSGGPLFAPVADGSLRLVGVTSWTSTSNPCATWTVFTRISAVRDWVSSIPEDTGGAAGLVAPTGVDATRTDDVDELHVTWTRSTTPGVARYRIHRQALLGYPYFGFGFAVPATMALAAVTGGDDTDIDLYGVEPQRRGENETRVIRVDAEDDEGNRVTGDPVRVPAPIDAVAPGKPSSLKVRHVAPRRHGKARISVIWTGARDNDCIGAYRVQVRGADNIWRTNSLKRTYDCDPLASPYPFGAGGNHAQRLPRVFGDLAGIAAGDYLVRIVAADRAGNLSVSRAVPVHVEERIPRRRSYAHSCTRIGFSVICLARATTSVDVIVR